MLLLLVFNNYTIGSYQAANVTTCIIIIELIVLVTIIIIFLIMVVSLHFNFVNENFKNHIKSMLPYQ